MTHRLDPLLKPASIALVGASGREGGPGRILADLVLDSSYAGIAYPVNPGYESIGDHTCYPDLDSLPQTVEHAVLAVANERLEQALSEAIAHGAQAVTIYSSCVLDDDAEPVLKARLAAMANEAGVAVCGGNGMGFYNITRQLYAGIFPMPGGDMPAGHISYIAQSGSAFSALAHNGVRLKFNLCVSSGNEIATTVADYMDWSLAQEETRVIGLFLETVRDPRAFVAALERARDRDIPVVMLRVGRSPLGAEMARTHTGAVVGASAAYEAMAKRYGVIEVADFGELMATLATFQSPQRPGTGRLATIHESGGLMELSTDIAHAEGIPLATLAPATRAELARHLDPGLKADNPLDAWGSNHEFERRFHACLSALVRDPDVAVGMFVSNFRDGYYLSEAFFRVMKKVRAETDKPLIMANCHGDLAHESLCHRSRDAGIPFVDGARESMRAVKHMFSYRDFRRSMTAESDQPEASEAVVTKWRERLRLDSKPLGERDALSLLGDFDIPVAVTEQAADESALLAAAARVGYPLVLKTAAPGVEHKTDVGGVVVGIADQASLLHQYGRLRKSSGPKVLVCQMISPGTEIGLGMINDAQFGPVIMVSAGGVLIELLEDRAVALAPVTAAEADALLSSLRSDALLRGIRGRPAANRAALVDLIVRFSRMCFELGDCLAEIDINPVIVNENGAIAVDALVLAAGRQTHRPPS